MSQFVPTGFVGSVQRLALGLEPRDAMLGSRVPHPIEVAVDGPPFEPARHLRDPNVSRWDPQDVLERITRRNSGRHLVVYRDGVADPLELRLLDRSHRYVPRRLRIRLPDPASLGRVCRPVLFPGAAYGVAAGALGVRGRIERDGAPLRWARVEARRPDGGPIVGRAHGDRHGEFLLLLDAHAIDGPEASFPIRVEVTVFGPDVVPVPGSDSHPEIDPSWDLPLEEAAISPAGEQVLRGEALPAGYVSRPNSRREVEITSEGPVRELFDFS